MNVFEPSEAPVWQPLPTLETLRKKYTGKQVDRSLVSLCTCLRRYGSVVRIVCATHAIFAGYRKPVSVRSIRPASYGLAYFVDLLNAVHEFSVQHRVVLGIDLQADIDGRK